MALVGIIHGHLPIDAEQGEKGEAKDKFSGFFRNSIEPLLDAMDECDIHETESSAIACRFFQVFKINTLIILLIIITVDI